MVYVGETPWHGLGVKVESIRELPAILDWRIVKRPVWVEGKEGKLEDLKQGAKVKAMYEEKDGKNVAAKLEVSE